MRAGSTSGDILAAPNRRLLEDLAWANVTLVFDYDGTLAPTVGDPDEAVMPRSTRDRLVEAAQLYPCAVLSGRAYEDVARFLEGVPLTLVVGNHGAEWEWDPPGVARLEEQVRRWRRELARALAPYPGVVVEDKRYSLTVHYRHAGRRGAARAIRAAASRLEGARLLGGKECVSVVPRGSETKGSALQRIRTLCRCEAAVYVGDDVTDEDVFVLKEPWLLGIRVGRGERTSARFRLRRQADIDALLDVFIRCRRRTSMAR
ncbi:MAG TPA: trehalose-phosphatase [Myxococcaceae bacterium]